MDEFETALKYPFRGDSTPRLFFGFIMSVMSFAVFPAFVLLGYYVTVFRRTATGMSTPPPVTTETIIPYFTTGFKSFFIISTYTLIPSVVVFLGVVTVATVVTTPTASTSFIAVVAFVTLCFLIVSYAVIPIAVYLFAVTGSVRAAFNIRRVQAIAFTVSYLRVILLSVTALLFFTVSVTVVSSIPVLGWVFAAIAVPILQFSVMISIHHLIGTVITRNTDVPVNTDFAGMK